MNSCGSGNINFQFLCAGHADPSQDITAFDLLAENRCRNQLQFIDVDVRFIKPVEHYQSIDSPVIKLVDHIKDVGEPETYL